MATQRKIDNVKELTDKMSKAKSVVFADYRGLTHKQLEDLRKILKKLQAEFVVAKNTLLLKSLPSSYSSLLTPHSSLLSGPTATLFSYADEVTPISELFKFAKTFSLPTVKFGFLGKQELTKEDITRLAKLPNRKVLLSQLVGQLKAPVYGLHRALNWNLQKLVFVLNSVKNTKRG